MGDDFSTTLLDLNPIAVVATDRKGRIRSLNQRARHLLGRGARREVLEGQAIEPAEVLAALDRVTAEDLRRVAADIVAADGFKLAVIGPFGDAERFEKLLG